MFQASWPAEVRVEEPLQSSGLIDDGAYNSVMTASQTLPWKRLLAEAVAIVLSILLAFSIDAWWDNRSDRHAEQLLLQRLKADFTDIQSAILMIEAEHRETSAACIALMSVPDGASIPSTPEYDRMVALVFLTSRTFNPGTGAVAAFLNSEGAKLVDNQSLADLLLSCPVWSRSCRKKTFFFSKDWLTDGFPF